MRGSIKERIVRTTYHAAVLTAVLKTNNVWTMSVSAWMQMGISYPKQMSFYPMEGLTALRHGLVRPYRISP